MVYQKGEAWQLVWNTDNSESQATKWNNFGWQIEGSNLPIESEKLHATCQGALETYLTMMEPLKNK